MNPHSIVPLSYIIELNYGLPEGAVRYEKKMIFDLLKTLGESLDYVNSRQKDENSWILSKRKQAPEIAELRIFPDKLVIIQEHMRASKEVFLQELDIIIKSFVELFKVPIVVLRRYVIRVTAEAKEGMDTREFLGDRVCGLVPAKRESLKRPIQLVGLRFIFPPYRDETKEVNNEFTIRLESRINEPKKMFIENDAKFLEPTIFLSLEKFKAEFEQTLQFITTNVSDFLQQYNI
jgi:hypothetical protein